MILVVKDLITAKKINKNIKINKKGEEMTNNLRKAKKDLCSFAKKCKDFKYTDSALITFLITGAVNIANNLFSAETGKSIENQKQVISTSIKDIHNQFTEVRRENDKLLKKSNMELIKVI